MKRNLYDLLPLLNEARQLHLKAIWDTSDDVTYIYKNNKYYFKTPDEEIEVTEKYIKDMWKLAFGVKFDKMTF